MDTMDKNPEHSSARIVRILELCDGDLTKWLQSMGSQTTNCNMQVVYLTRPANLLHVLRQHMQIKSCKSLIIFFSNSLLRHPLARSSLQELSGTAGSQPVLEDSSTPLTGSVIERAIVCSGQVFAASHEHREKQKANRASITRILFLTHKYPKFRKDTPARKEIVWCQEESYNSGSGIMYETDWSK
ncbi:hypothetical protein BKA66DRAFT_582474 [Pyrenochaeta sp. MPI-SDFR-AT-0127]|nr:hypothetical protein BKA66DRAFT_582474 [Pyrenochaeta sp. MPI-SDFR-AT-0127]